MSILARLSVYANDPATPGGEVSVDDSTTLDLLNSVRDFIGPIFLLIVAAVSLTFIFKRQTTQLFQFLAIAVVVAILFYSTDIIPAIANFVAGWFGA